MERESSTSKLSREDRFILEKHGQDLFKMLLRSLLSVDRDAEVSITEKIKIRRLIEEYFETRALLLE